MISMNMRPPRPTPASREDRLPAVKARILNSGKRNMGSAARCSIMAKATSSAAPPLRQPSTNGLVHPMVAWP
jgi:hypothetical protein